MALIIEFLTKGDKVIRHLRLNQNQVNIGRDYSNDVYVDDPYADNRHLEITYDEESQHIRFQDLGSVNGTLVNKKTKLNGELDGSEVIAIGRTRMRIFVAKPDNTPAIKLSAFEKQLGWMNSVPMAIGLTVIYLFVTLIGQYLLTFGEFQMSSAITIVGKKAMLLCIWPLVFAVAARVVNKESHVYAQFSLLWIFLLFLQCIELIALWLKFNFNINSLIGSTESIIFVATFFVFIWSSMYIGFNQGKKRRLWVSAALCLVYCIPTFLLPMLKTKPFIPFPIYQSYLLPPAYSIDNAVDSDAFLQTTESIFTELEKEKNK